MADEEITGSLLQKMLEKQERMFGQMAVIMDRLAKRLDQIEDRFGSVTSESDQTEASGQGLTGPSDDPFTVEPQLFADPQEVREQALPDVESRIQEFADPFTVEPTAQQPMPDMGSVRTDPLPPQEPSLSSPSDTGDPFGIEPLRGTSAEQLETQWTDEIPGLKIQHTRDGIIGVYDTPQDTTQDVDEMQRAQSFAREEQWNSLVKYLDLQQKFIYQHDVRIERLYDALRARQ